MTFESGQQPHVTGFRYSSVAYSEKEVCFLKGKIRRNYNSLCFEKRDTCSTVNRYLFGKCNISSKKGGKKWGHRFSDSTKISKSGQNL